MVSDMEHYVEANEAPQGLRAGGIAPYFAAPKRGGLCGARALSEWRTKTFQGMVLLLCA